MEFCNCPRCGKLYNRINSNICPVCEKEEENTFQTIKTYIEDNPDCTLAAISEETKVSPKKILQYIKEGRLEVSKGMSGEITCLSCGRPISTGMYCDSCVIKINQNVDELFHKNKFSDTHDKNRYAKMHIVPKKR